MKTIILVFLLSVMAFGQTGKSVLTQAQEGSIGVIVSDSLNRFWDSTQVKAYVPPLDTAEIQGWVKDSLDRLCVMSIIGVISNDGFSNLHILDYAHSYYTIDSVYAIVRDSSISFMLYNSSSPFDEGNLLFTETQTVSSKTGIYLYPDNNATIPKNNYLGFQLLGSSGTINETIYLKIFFTLL